MKKILILTIIAAFIFNACEDEVLNKKPLDTITDATLWSDPVLIDDYLTECYSEMRFYFEMPYGKPLNSGSLSQIRALDAVTISDETQPSWISAPKSNWITISGGVFEWWGYPTIRKLNIFIEKVGALDLNESYKKQRLAEARFLRAFAYFNLVKRYGGVPLITWVQQLNDPEEELYPKRDKEDDVYQFILTEIDEIAEDLPEVYGDGRATKYAALALKSRAAMYAASIAQWGSVQLDGVVGIPSNKATTYWQATYDVSRSIIESGMFELYDKSADKVENYRNIFLDENNSEVIFSQRFDGKSGIGHAWDILNIPLPYNVWASGQHACVYLEMVESYDNIDGTSGVIDRQKLTTGVNNGHLFTVEELWGKKDPRFKASIYGHGTQWTHANGDFILDYHDGIEFDGKWERVGSYKGVLCKSKSTGRRTNFGVLKYLDKDLATEQAINFSKTDYIVFRYAEILLNYAEAAFELGKGDGLWAVNKLRRRAGMPELSSVTREDIRHERKVELAFEGNRYFDLRRWRIAKQELTHSFQGLRFILDGASIVEGQYDVLSTKFKIALVNNVSGSPAPYFDEKHYYLPIGLSRTGINNNLVENPGYQ